MMSDQRHNCLLPLSDMIQRYAQMTQCWICYGTAKLLYETHADVEKVSWEIQNIPQLNMPGVTYNMLIERVNSG